MRRLFLALAAAYALAAYGYDSQGFGEPAEMGEDAALPATPPPPGPGGPDRIDEVLERSRPELLAIPGVVGIGHGRTQDGDDAIIVWVTDSGAADRLPAEIEGYPVIVNTVPGGFHAYDG
jgi:hypothetical protein